MARKITDRDGHFAKKFAISLSRMTEMTKFQENLIWKKISLGTLAGHTLILLVNELFKIRVDAMKIGKNLTDLAYLTCDLNVYFCGRSNFLLSSIIVYEKTCNRE